jgi:hypothetical protein
VSEEAMRGVKVVFLKLKLQATRATSSLMPRHMSLILTSDQRPLLAPNIHKDGASDAI